MVAHLPEPIADVARFAYLSGWRRAEILGLRWDTVDRAAKEVRLRTSKNGHGRVLPLEDNLWDLIERRWAARECKETNGVTRLAAHVFHRRGIPVVDFQKPWTQATKAAGVPGKLFHDLRRTAVRNMVRAGVPQAIAMSLSGHRTISMFPGLPAGRAVRSPRSAAVTATMGEASRRADSRHGDTSSDTSPACAPSVGESGEFWPHVDAEGWPSGRWRWS